MSGIKSAHSSSDNFWSNSKKYVTTTLPLPKEREEKEETVVESPAAVDEALEFYDPYSDLTLFLSQKIKQEIQHCGSSKKWSLKIQEDLLSKIAPDFREKFPQYRLGTSALKKTWEKVNYYAQQIQQEKEALTEEGKINIPFFIKQNLKNYSALKNPSQIHPSHFAHQMAMKMSECIATIDGVRPELNYFSKMVWVVQRHLIADWNPEQSRCPYDDFDKIDRLIVKTILEISAKEPQIECAELEAKVKEALLSLHELPSFSSFEHLLCTVSALLAEKLHATSPFHTRFLAEQKTAMTRFIKRHNFLGKVDPHHPQLPELVRRLLALYTLASGLPKTVTEKEIKEAVASVYPREQSSCPELSQSLWAFIAAELVLMQSEELCRSPDYVAEAIWAAYQEASHLPKLEGKENDILEIAIWKSLSETEGWLEKLPYRVGLRIEEEIAGILIDNPTLHFSALVYKTVECFERAKALAHIQSWEEVEKKIHLWAIQGDMLCRSIRLDPENTLLRLIAQKWKEQSTTLPHHIFVSEICQTYLKTYPELAPYASQLSTRVWILYKYAWYTLFSTGHESSLDRLVKWHSSSLLFSGTALDHDHLSSQLLETIWKTAPLVPFDKKQADKALISS